MDEGSSLSHAPGGCIDPIAPGGNVWRGLPAIRRRLPVPGTNLTRDEARTRGDLLRIDTYAVDLDFTAGGATFDSVTEIHFACTSPGASTFVDLIAPRVRAITLNGRALDPAATYLDSRVHLDDLAADNELRIVADCAYMNTGEGLHRYGRPGRRTHVPVHALRDARGAPALRQLRAAGPQGVASRSPSPRRQAGLVLSNSPAPTRRRHWRRRRGRTTLAVRRRRRASRPT